MENTRKAIAYLQACKENVLESLLADNVGEMITINITNKFDAMINSLAFLSGGLVDSTPVIYPPITNFMGEELTQFVEVVEEDIIPDEDTTKTFVEKVDALQSQLPFLESAKVVESYVTREDQLAVRGVAKRAKLEDFRTAEINITFVDRIRIALENLKAADVFKIGQDENIDK